MQRYPKSIALPLARSTAIAVSTVYSAHFIVKLLPTVLLLLLNVSLLLHHGRRNGFESGTAEGVEHEPPKASKE